MNDGYLAFDLGAETSRAVLGVYAEDRISLEEVHRHSHEIIHLPSGLHWDISGLWQGIVQGLTEAGRWVKSNNVTLQSVGVDTWGVDWALISKSGELVGLPHAYRDPRNEIAFQEVVNILGEEEIYSSTGNQLLSLNTLYSLYAHFKHSPETFASAQQMVFMPDLFHYWLSGKLSVEATVASTSQMVDCKTGTWATRLLAKLGLPLDLFPPITQPGVELGLLLPHLASATGLSEDTRVALPASHDTASAVAAFPASADSNWCYLSSGTSSLLGCELTEPATTAESQAAQFTNELGVEGRVRFLKNVNGLWILQECRRDWSRQGHEYDYAVLTDLASKTEPLRTVVDPAMPEFRSAGNMLHKIRHFASQTGQPVPDTPGRIVRCCLESLALTYRRTLRLLEKVLQRKFDVLHVVGGGGHNSMLNQMTADATKKKVLVGPIEATAYGNIMTQALAAGEISSLNELRSVVANSVHLQEYFPSGRSDWTAVERRVAGTV